MKIKIKRSLLKQVAKQVLRQQDRYNPSGDVSIDLRIRKQGLHQIFNLLQQQGAAFKKIPHRRLVGLVTNIHRIAQATLDSIGTGGQQVVR